MAGQCLPSTLVSYLLSVYAMRFYCVFAINVVNNVGDASHSPKRCFVGAAGHRAVPHSEFLSCCASCPVNQNQSMLMFCTTHNNMFDVMCNADNFEQLRGARPGNPTSSHELQLQSPSIKIFHQNTRYSILNVFLCCAEQHCTCHSDCGGSRGELRFSTTTVAPRAKISCIYVFASV